MTSIEYMPSGPRPTLEAVYFVMQRDGMYWTPSAKALRSFTNEIVAEKAAAEMKRLHPQQCFGVFALRSEAREVEQPVMIVRANA